MKLMAPLRNTFLKRTIKISEESFGVVNGGAPGDIICSSRAAVAKRPLKPRAPTEREIDLDCVLEIVDFLRLEGIGCIFGLSMSLQLDVTVDGVFVTIRSLEKQPVHVER